MAPIRCCFDQTAVWHSDAARGPSTPSFDHLVGSGDEGCRHVEAERLGGLQVEHELKLGRLLHRKVGGVGAFEDAVHVGRRASVEIYDYKRQGTIIVIHAHSLSWSWRSRHLTPFVAGRSKDVREVGIRAVPDYEEFIGAKKHLVLGLSSHTGPPQGSNSFAIG